MVRVPREFLIEEVRDGFFIPASIKQSWAADLEVLLEIDRVCKKHNIQYFADWGTLLGTVRHGGFIPWDDDLDIVMKREDYNRFVNVAANDMEEGFFVQTYENTEPENWLFMGKVVGCNHICFEPEHLRRFHNFPYMTCVDIFVLDYVDRNSEREKERRDICLYMLSVAEAVINGDIKGNEIKANLNHIESKWRIRVPYVDDAVEMGRTLYRKVEHIFARVPESESDYLVQLYPWGLKGTARLEKKEYYEDAVYLPFEMIKMPVPKAYDEMLRDRYGDYLHIVKSGGAHEYPSFEAQKRIFFNSIDMKLPEFEFEPEKLNKGLESKEQLCSLKDISKKTLEEIERLCGYLGDNLTDSLSEINGLAESIQQTAIDFGMVVESLMGADCRIVKLLEQLCEQVYVITQEGVTNNNLAQINAILDYLGEQIDEDIISRRTVVFMVVHKSELESIKILLQRELAKENTDVIVTGLTCYYKDYDGSLTDCFNEFATDSDEVILDIDPIMLALINPEIIYITNSYDNWNENISVAPEYFVMNLKKSCNELVYISSYNTDDYSKNDERDYLNLGKYLCMPGAVYADKIIAKNEAHRLVFVDKLTEFTAEQYRGIWEQRIIDESVYHGNISYDLKPNVLENDNISKNESNIKSKKTILYLTSIGCILKDLVIAEAKIEEVMNTFLDNAETISVNWYVYPVDELERREDIKILVERIRNKYCTNDSNINYVDYEITKAEAVETADAYYGDGSSFVHAFTRNDKPVMICNYDF